MVTKTFHQAILDFRQARRQAERERRRARRRGGSAELLSYEQVRQMLRGKTGAATGLDHRPAGAGQGREVCEEIGIEGRPVSFSPAEGVVGEAGIGKTRLV